MITAKEAQKLSDQYFTTHSKLTDINIRIIEASEKGYFNLEYTLNTKGINTEPIENSLRERGFKIEILSVKNRPNVFQLYISWGRM